MIGGSGRRSALIGTCTLVVLGIAWSAAGAPAPVPKPAAQTRPAAKAPERARGQPPAPAEPAKAKPPRAFLIYLIDGGEPIIVKRYVEENDQIRFEKYGGWVGIPRYEILRIVPDEPEAIANLPPPAAPAPDQETPPPARASESLYVTLRGGVNLKATAVVPEGDRVRVTAPEGSFTVPRSDLVGVIRVPSGPDTPEAWLSILATEAAPDRASGGEPLVDSVRPASADPRPASFPSSNRPHLVRLANGQLLRVEGFWIEDGEIRFQRLGGMVGVALSEVLRVIPEEMAPVHGRRGARYWRQLGPDLLEVRLRDGPQRVRLIGVEPVAGTRTAESPWDRLERGLVIYLEFDRQRYESEGDWLAYVFLPNGRMLNAELIRLGLARPRADGRNVRYLDLFHEIATPEPSEGGLASPSR